MDHYAWRTDGFTSERYQYGVEHSIITRSFRIRPFSAKKRREQLEKDYIPVKLEKRGFLRTTFSGSTEEYTYTLTHFPFGMVCKISSQTLSERELRSKWISQIR